MRHLSFLSSFLFLGLLFLGCSDKKEIAFYAWKSKCEITKDFSYPVYVKVLDFGDRVIKTTCSHSHVPVVYIDNQALKKTPIKKITSTVFKNIKGAELQVDCDWTNATKEKYFKLLKLLKKRYKNISVTIRLHQLKYQKQTGIPPVTKGVLMFYNMSDFLNPKTKNYILDLDVAKSYLKGFKSYPLKLDLALPLYSQATIMRDDKVIGLIDDIRKKELDKFFKKISKNHYQLTKTHYFKGRLFYEGDVIRVDEVSLKMLKKALNLIPFDYKKVIFFRYSNLKDWDIEKLKDLS